jgi:2-(3-amino-3-carboxypropyl)histidine synthase
MNQLQELIAKIRASGHKPERAMLQLPNGLKHRSFEIAEAIGKALSCKVIVAGNPCYGACDLPLEEAGMSKADLIVHVGHKPFYVSVPTKVPVVYYDWPIEVTLDEKKIFDALSNIPEKRIGLATSVQYLHTLEKVKSILESKSKQVFIGGYVLGCWAEGCAALKGKVDCFLFVGSGRFHPFGFDCKYFLDFERAELSDISKEVELFDRRKWARIAKAKDARSFCILVTSKSGQKELLGKAEEIKAKLEGKDKKAFILMLDEISDAALLGVPADAFVNTACPRLQDDEWKKPVINATDLDKVLED